MAAPVIHLLLAYQALAVLTHVTDREQFLRGSVFPDIRYSAGLARDSTHDMSMTWERVKNEKDPFKAGVFFHSLVDVEREDFMHKSGIYKKLPSGLPRLFDAMKFVEDGVLFPELSHKTWADIISALEPVDDAALAYGVTADQVRKWQTMVRYYVQIYQHYKPYMPTFLKALQLLPLKGGIGETVVSVKALLRDHKQLLESAARRFYQEFPKDLRTKI
jgi:hypothetical protein